ncbi:hypothetical protein F53441_3252 [Fusarium austroafricanum]|uniref:Uncharacterized protein n=1 Tax=Fusarium austroafricanum TaxID=2364996 RepID=A0A8H4KN89_9HYPO|nr:hypothetical protein F53441_3252 [Fusarium austroafricanum]
MIWPPKQPTKQSQLLTRGADFLQLLQQLLKRHIYVSVSLNGIREDLSTITQSVCYTTVQLEAYAREAKTFDWPNFVQLQDAAVATYRLCHETRSDSQRLNELVDQLGVESSAVETAIRKVRDLLADIRKKPVVSDAEIDGYEAEMMMIGQNTMKVSEGDFILPKPASI